MERLRSYFIAGILVTGPIALTLYLIWVFIRFIDDAGWLRQLVESLTNEHERNSAKRWRITDAPADYIAGMVRAIVGFEIRVSAIEGKFKASQNRSAADRAGVAEALRAAGLPADEVTQLAPEGGS